MVLQILLSFFLVIRYSDEPLFSLTILNYKNVALTNTNIYLPLQLNPNLAGNLNYKSLVEHVAVLL